jgi:hypothetical protein
MTAEGASGHDPHDCDSSRAVMLFAFVFLCSVLSSPTPSTPPAVSGSHGSIESEACLLTHAYHRFAREAHGGEYLAAASVATVGLVSSDPLLLPIFQVTKAIATTSISTHRVAESRLHAKRASLRVVLHTWLLG